MQEDWLRLEKVIKWAGLSVNSFARAVGLNRAENLYQIKKGNNGISRDLAFLISAKYPQISKGWILTGEGNMFTNDSLPCLLDSVLRYGRDEVRSQSGGVSDQEIHIGAYVRRCGFRGRILRRGHACQYSVGSTVVLKRETAETIVPGRAYVVVSDRISLLRYVRRDNDTSRLRLVAQDRSMYDDVCIDEAQIKDLYVVRGVIITKTA